MTRRHFLTLSAAAIVPALQGNRPIPSFMNEVVSVRKARYLAEVRRQPLRRIRVENGKVHFLTPDPGKHLWNAIFAALDGDPTGNTPFAQSDVTPRQLISQLLRFPDLFHFNADGPAACLMRYPERIDPADREFFFVGHSQAVFHRTEGINYHLFTSEGTENHIAMSRYSGYLLCQNWLQDHPDDIAAKEGSKLCREYILTHARDVYRGGTGEWNSSTYYGYQLRGLLTCFEFAEGEVRDACRALLDFFATEMALKCGNGVLAGPESRGSAVRTSLTDAEQIAAYWFNEALPLVSEPSNAVYAAISSYRPPDALLPLARKQNLTDTVYYNSHSSYLLDMPAFSRETLYLGKGYILGCAYLPYAGYTGATQQFLPWKLVVDERETRSEKPQSQAASPWCLLGNSNARSEDGQGRGPYDQWAQYRNVLVQLTWVPSDATERAQAAKAITRQWQDDWRQSFVSRWNGKQSGNAPGPTIPNVRTENIMSYLIFPTEGTEIVTSETVGIVFVRYGQVFIAVRSLKGVLPQRELLFVGEAKERVRLIEPVATGETGGFVLEVGTEQAWKTFAAFQTTVKQKTHLDKSRLATDGEITYRTLLGDQLTVRYGKEAPRPLIEPLFDWGYIPSEMANRPMSVPKKPPIVQPTYPKAGQSLDGWGRIPTVRVNGKSVPSDDFWDTTRPWPVFSGPHVTLQNRVLTVKTERGTYKVDYSGDRPKFSETR